MGSSDKGQVISVRAGRVAGTYHLSLVTYHAFPEWVRRVESFPSVPILVR